MPISARSILLFAIGAVFGAGVLGGYVLYRRTGQIQKAPTYALQDDILVHGNTELKEIALTFDDGPHPETARAILAALGKKRIKATFFLVGNQIQKNPAIVRRMLAEGHEVGNHSFSHPNLTGLDAQAISEEMLDCSRAFHAATGTYMHLFRPPGMRYDPIVIRSAQDVGYVTIHWNAAAKDFVPTNPSVIEERIVSTVRPGSVVLLHDHPDTAVALPRILDALEAKGYRFVTVSQMLARLPRPVQVKTNAYAVEWNDILRPTESAPVASKSRR